MKRIRRILVDSSVYGAAIEDESEYHPRTREYWDAVYSRALFRLGHRLEMFGCEPISVELKKAPEILREKLLALYSNARELRLTPLVSRLYARYRAKSIFPPDALIAAFASAHGLDALVTVNRRHLMRSDTVKKVASVNRRFRLGRLLILLPQELLELLR
jgi:predicted nucleic acid-binding protein